MEPWIVLSLLVLAVVLFATEKLSVDLVTLMILSVLVLTGILPLEEAFAGFSSDIVVMLASIFVIGTAMRDTGVLDVVGRAMSRTFGNSPLRLTAAMMAGVGVLSAFMNNTTVTAMFVGPVMRLAHQVKMSPSRLLMPLAFASILGGGCTLIGTSTNVAVSGYLKKHDMEELGMFEFTGVGAIILVVGIVYMLVVGRRLLPERADQAGDEMALREYLAEVAILPESPLIGQEVYQSDFSVLEFQVLKILRRSQEIEATRHERFEEGDVVLVAGQVANLIRIKKIEGLDILEDLRLRKAGSATADAHIAEVVLTPRSHLVGRTLRESRFRQSSGLSVLALMRGDKSLVDKVAEVRLKAGDLMLVQGPYERIRRYEDESEMVVITDHPHVAAGMGRGLILLGVFVAAIMAGSLGWIPLPMAMLITALLSVLLKCVTMETAYENIDWRLLILIAGMTAFGHAMTTSGAANMVSSAVVKVLSPLGPVAVLAGFGLLAMVLTQQMSNAAAALVILPVALQAAANMHLNERPFALTVMLSASLAVVTPFEPSCLLVYGPGKYRFSDFARVGGWLAVITLVLIVILVPLIWPLK